MPMSNLISKLAACHQHQRKFERSHKMCRPDLQSLYPLISVFKSKYLRRHFAIWLYCDITNGNTAGCLPLTKHLGVAWWRHQIETFSALLALCAGNSPVTAQRPVTRSFDVFFVLRLNKRLSKQSKSWWFVMPSRSLRLHCNATPANNIFWNA